MRFFKENKSYYVDQNRLCHRLLVGTIQARSNGLWQQVATFGSKTSHGVRSVTLVSEMFGPMGLHLTPRSGVRVPMGREDVFRISLGMRMALSVGAPIALRGTDVTDTIQARSNGLWKLGALLGPKLAMVSGSLQLCTIF